MTESQVLPFPAQSDSQDDQAALAACAMQMAALGSETRLSLFRLLVQYGDKGLNVGDISAALSLAGSTLNHHLVTLETANLIERVREGRNIRCRVLTAHMHELVNYLTENCCCEAHDHD